MRGGSSIGRYGPVASPSWGGSPGPPVRLLAVCTLLHIHVGALSVPAFARAVGPRFRTQVKIQRLFLASSLCRPRIPRSLLPVSSRARPDPRTSGTTWPGSSPGPHHVMQCLLGLRFILWLSRFHANVCIVRWWRWWWWWPADGADDAGANTCLKSIVIACACASDACVCHICASMWLNAALSSCGSIAHPLLL